MKIKNTLVLGLVGFSINSYGAPDISKAFEGQVVVIKLAQVSAKFPEPIAESYEKFQKKENQKDFSNIEPYGKPIKWIEATMWKKIKNIAIPDDVKKSFTKWFTSAKWADDLANRPVGLAPQAVIFFADSEDENTYWKIDVFDQKYATIQVAFACMDGCYQARPDTKISVVDGEISDLIWTVLKSKKE